MKYEKEYINKLIEKIQFCIDNRVKFEIGEDKISIVMHPETIREYTGLLCHDTVEVNLNEGSRRYLEYQFASDIHEYSDSNYNK
jgi:hypothetical protein